MKTRFLLTAFVAMILFVISTNTTAQVIQTTEANIDWENHSSTIEAAVASGEQVYLYAPAQTATGNVAGFLAMQGTFGVHGVLRSTGQRLRLEPVSAQDGVYAIQTSVQYTMSNGSLTNGYLGRVSQDNQQLYLDRHTSESNVETDWHFTPVTTGTNTGYKICFGNYDYKVEFGSTIYDWKNWPLITITATPQSSRDGIIFDRHNVVSITYSYSDADKKIQCGNGSTLSAESEELRLKTKSYTLTLIGAGNARDEAERAFEAGEVNDWYNQAMAELKARCENNILNAQPANAAVTWYIITESDFRNLILAQKDQSYLNVSGLLYDQRFERNNVDENAKWNWDGAAGGYFIGLSSEVGRNGGSNALMDIAEDYGAYYAAEVSGTGKLTQKVEVPRPGLYAVSCQGFYYDDVNSSNANTNSYLYATSGSKEEQVLLDKLPNSNFQTFNNYSTTLYGRYSGWSFSEGSYNYTQYYQRNVAAGQLMAGNDRWTAPENTYLNTVFINVAEKAEDGKYYITLGVNKTSDTGYAYVDNFKLIYVGDAEILFDERATASEQNGNEYTYPTILNLRRTFAYDDNGGKWNPIILPMSLTGDQVKQAFGHGDAKLSVLDGLTMTSANTYSINFKSVDLDNEGLEAGKCYIVYVTKGPDIAKGVEYKMPSSLEEYGEKVVTGPIYQFAVNNQASYDPSDEVEGSTADVGYGVVDYYGYYAKQTTGYLAGDFIMEKGDMYHLDEPWGKVKYASEWSLRVPALEAPMSSVKFTMKIDNSDEGEATGIIDIKVMCMDEPAMKENTAIYNVSGQKVSGNINTLPKGLYIRNGRKFLVK